MKGLLEGLNEAQRAAVVAAPERPLLVVAGAGTGKTRTLTARVAWLVEQGLAPERIMLLTFTRRAAREMLGRVRALGGPRQALQPLGGTFHSVAYRLIRRHAGALALGDHTTVIDGSDVADLVDLIRESLGMPLSGRRVARKGTLAEIYSRTINQQRPLAEILVEHYPWCLEAAVEIAELCRELTRRKREAQLLDFDDLLLYWRAAAPTTGSVRSSRPRFDHISSTSTRTSTHSRSTSSAAPARCRPRLTVVGDDLQAVYGFRGRQPRHLLDIRRASRRCRRSRSSTTTARSSRSSMSPTISAAEARRLQTRLARRAVGEPRTTAPRRCDDEDAKAEVVCEQVLAHREEGIALAGAGRAVRAGHHSDHSSSSSAGASPT